MNILLTLSQENALHLLNGKPFVSSFKIPISTAYIYVSKRGGPIWEPCYPPNGKPFQRKLNGLVVAKCEITKVEGQYCGKNLEGLYGVNGTLEPDYKVYFTALTVFDEPLTLSQFDCINSKLVKACNDGLDRLYVPTRRVCTRKPIKRAPSRWMSVVVGE